jgi:hypothetical protein
VNGKEDLNYLNTLQRKPTQQEWKDKADFIGVNYYRGLYVYYHPIVAASAAKFIGGVPLNDLRYEKQPHALLNDLGWEIYPEGLYKTLMHIKNQWNIPVIITENGIADRNGDKRGPYIVSHLEQVKRAMDSGANVLGYFHWSLMDNYEWQYHYNPESRFGLYQVDRNTDEFKRTPTKGVEALHLIINASNGGEVTDSAVSKAKDRFGAYTPDGSEIVKPSQFLTDNKIISEADISQSNQAQSADSKQMESYRLIVYLDGVSQQNAIRDNFKIVVYNSDNDTILSAKPNIDFNDNHQKISPKSGYTIKGKLGEHPNQITVCAQQEYELNGKKLAHDNCYPIKQNVQKTYWYTIFDYGQIDAFEGDIQSKTELSSQINGQTSEPKQETSNSTTALEQLGLDMKISTPPDWRMSGVADGYLVTPTQGGNNSMFIFSAKSPSNNLEGYVSNDIQNLQNSVFGTVDIVNKQNTVISPRPLFSSYFCAPTWTLRRL